MKESGISEQNIESFIIRTDDEIISYKRRAVKYIIDAHSRFFKELLEFHDWKSAMNILDSNSHAVQSLFIKDEK
jgi:hypothetical protein|tara:strand:- start:178 stop:399 length:222 start_codon:yes stop_codon:yes gene_type:complete